MGDLACLTQQDVGYESHHNHMWKGKHTLSLIYLNESLVHWVCYLMVRRPVCMFMVVSNDLFPRHVKCWSGKSRQHGWLGQIKSRSLAETEGEDRLWYGCFNSESRDCRLFLVEWFIFSHCVSSVIIDPLLNWANPFRKQTVKRSGNERAGLEVFMKVASPRTCEWQSVFSFYIFWRKQHGACSC